MFESPTIKPAVAPYCYALSTECPVRWTITQERSISMDYPFTDMKAETPQDYVSRIYLQFLWLPEPIMPLRFLVPSLLRIRSHHSQSSGPSSLNAVHPLHDFLQPVLLTPRSAAQKYHSHIKQFLDSDVGAGDVEESMMWFALKNEKTDEAMADETDFEAEERWKNDWLVRMERREVQIQILLHLLLLSLSGDPPKEDAANFVPELPPHLSPSKKRKRRQRESPELPALSIEERLESFMDKMSMWQLMASLEVDDAQRDKFDHTNTKDKQDVLDERDWMQMFCEDVVGLQFKSKLPELCGLLHSKVFPSSPFADDSETLSLSPSMSPQQKHKIIKTSASVLATSSRSRPQESSENEGAEDSRSRRTQDSQRARSRSLSVSLEEERARSRSISIGPGNLRKRVLVREVSMTTVFKGKARAKEREQARAATAARTKAARNSQRSAHPDGHRGKTRDSDKGVMLVAATPVKPKAQKGHASQHESSTQSHDSSRDSHNTLRLPKCDFGEVVDEDCEQEDWNLSSAPDVLLLGSSSQGSSEMDHDGYYFSRGLLRMTPRDKSGEARL